MREQGGDTRIDAALKRIEALEAEAQGYDVAREVFTDRIEVLEAALREIAEQLLTDELPEGFRDGDYEYAYEQAVRVARAALAPEQDK